jgi:hypothetical protein
MMIDSCEEEELKETLANVDKHANSNSTSVKFDVTCVSSDKFTLSMPNELDEDDDQIASHEADGISKPTSEPINNATADDDDDHKENNTEDTRFETVFSTSTRSLKVLFFAFTIPNGA